MCLPFSCGGSDKGDDGSQHDPSVEQPYFRPPQQQAPLPPPPRPARSDYDEDSFQPYNKPSSSPEKEAFGHHGTTNMPAAAPGRMTTDFGYSGGDVVRASAGVVRGREGQSAAAAGKIVASTTPATQGFNDKHRDLAAQHPSEAADNMKAPLPVLPMARRGGY